MFSQKRNLFLFLALIVLALIVLGGFYYFTYQKREKPKEEQPIVLPEVKYGTYKIFDEDLLKYLNYDKDNKYVVLNKIGMKQEGLPELDGKKIYMPFDGKVKYRKMPALGITSDYWWTYLEIYDSSKNVVLNIWGSFEPVNLELGKELFKPKGAVIGEFPKVEPGKKYDVFNDFLVINAFKLEPYKQDLEYLREIFPSLEIK